jgi:hypothetical protein
MNDASTQKFSYTLSSNSPGMNFKRRAVTFITVGGYLLTIRLQNNRIFGDSTGNYHEIFWRNMLNECE